MYDSANLHLLLDSAVQCKDGKYRPSRPYEGFLSQRFRDAWQVLRGRAVAVYMYDGSETSGFNDGH